MKTFTCQYWCFWNAQQHCNPSKSNWIFFYLFGFLNKIIVCTKDKAFNLWTLTNALINIIFCSPLDLSFPFVRSCFGNAMSKATKYVIDDTTYVLDFQIWTWKMFKHHCITLLFGKKSWKGKKNGRIIVSLQGYYFKCSKHMWKQ